MKTLLLWAAIFVLSACQAPTQDIVSVENGWVRATVAGQPVAAAYMDISAQQAVSLVEVSCDLVESVEIHQMQMQQGVMRMRRLEKLDIDAGKTVHLSPGNTHLMLINLNAPLNAGQKVAMQFIFQQSDGNVISRRWLMPVKQK
jgi:copper(I)-binding protein